MLHISFIKIFLILPRTSNLLSRTCLFSLKESPLGFRSVV